jgi:membrane associated rhomboid family serine protease
MGFQDRDYMRDVPYDDDGYRRRGGTWSVSARLVLLNFALFFVNGLFFQNIEDPQNFNWLTRNMEMSGSTLFHPLEYWKFLTYGFAHSPQNFWHIAGNMLCLVMFAQGLMLGIGPGGFGIVRGENVEDRLGRTEFFWFYILTILFGGIVYGLTNLGDRTPCLGASGGVCGVIVLYALLYPNKTLYLYGILPLPMWMIGVFIVGMDALGASGKGEGGIAYSVHLAGAAFALFYYFTFLKNRRRMTDIFVPKKRKPKLKIYDGEEPKPKTKTAADLEFDRRLDEILDRYGKVGEAGLTKEEREFLKKASQKYKNR